MVRREVFIDDPEDLTERNNAIATAEALDERMLTDEFTLDGKRKLVFVDADDDPDQRVPDPLTSDQIEFVRIQGKVRAKTELTLGEVTEYFRQRDGLDV